MKTGRILAAALAMLWWAGAHITPAAGADSTDSFDETPRRSHDHAQVLFDGEATRPAGLIAGASARVHEQVRAALETQYRPLAGSTSVHGAPIDALASDLLVRLHYVFSSVPGVSSDRAYQDDGGVSLKNSDAFIRTKVQLTQSKEWRGFVYADIGAADSELRWQGLAGVHGRRGVDLLGGWRHVTYRFSPGRGFDSLDFNGPFLGAAVAW